MACHIHKKKIFEGFEGPGHRSGSGSLIARAQVYKIHAHRLRGRYT